MFTNSREQHNFGLQTLAWSKLLILTGKKLAFKFSTYIFEYWPLPPSSTSHPLTWWMLPSLSPFAPIFCSHVLLWTQTECKTGGGLERGWSNLFQFSWSTPFHGWTNISMAGVEPGNKADQLSRCGHLASRHSLSSNASSMQIWRGKA